MLTKAKPRLQIKDKALCGIAEMRRMTVRGADKSDGMTRRAKASNHASNV